MQPRPLPVIVIACVYILTGLVGFGYHATEFWSQRPIPSDLVWIESVRLLAAVAGVFLLRGQSWARWLAIAWIAFHVALGAMHSLPQFAIHALFCAAIAYFLLRPEANRYFRAA